MGNPQSLRDAISEAESGLEPFEAAGVWLGVERESYPLECANPVYAVRIIPVLLFWLRSNLKSEELLISEELEIKLITELSHFDQTDLKGLSVAIRLTIRGLEQVSYHSLSQARIDTYQLTKVQEAIDSVLLK